MEHAMQHPSLFSLPSGHWKTVEAQSLSCLLKHLDNSVSKQSHLAALSTGRRAKLICGASFEDVAEVRSLSLIYALAGVNCIDCAADEAVVTAVLEGVAVAKDVGLSLGYQIRDPWLMVSINDDEDPHFRKAEFNPEYCPRDCPRPCERVCPASAIHFSSPHTGGVFSERCYGCGRCIPVCPVHNIVSRTYIRSSETVSELLRTREVDAVEIHTGKGHLEAFQRLVVNLAPALKRLKLLAVSLPDMGDPMRPAMRSMHEIMRQNNIVCPNLWQLDGRPMSGDIGKGATHAAISLAAKLSVDHDRPPGFLQLAGGTNSHTMQALETAGFNASEVPAIAGIAFGGYARQITKKLLQKLENADSKLLENHPGILIEAVHIAAKLIWPVMRCPSTW